MTNRVPEFKIDSYSPQEMAERVKTVGVKKAGLDFWTTLSERGVRVYLRKK